MAAAGEHESGFAPGHAEILDALSGSDNYNAWLFARARPHLGARVLDLGAGIGTFTAFAAELAELVVALEPDADFAALLERRFGATTNVQVEEREVGALEPGLAPGGFDSVICFNVLEHVPDDRDALERVRKVLRPGGRLLLLVPAHPQLYGQLDRSIGHVRRYRRRPLGALLAASGLDVEELRYVNPAGAIGWLASARLLRRTEFPYGGMRVFDGIVPMLRHLDRVPLPFGLSVWAVGSRRARK